MDLSQEAATGLLHQERACLDMQPFLARLTIGSSYIPPKFPSTLDGILFGAVRLLYPDCEDLSRVPLRQTDGVFHGSSMICELLFPAGETKFFRSINNENSEELLPEVWMDTGLYKNTNPEIDISEFRKGSGKRGTFYTKADSYPLWNRGKTWEVGFYGCGDMVAVEKLLRVLPGIGRKASRGYGAIVDIEMEETDQDYSLVRNSEPARPLPMELWEKLCGGSFPAQKIRARLAVGNPDLMEVPGVAPAGGVLSW